MPRCATGRTIYDPDENHIITPTTCRYALQNVNVSPRTILPGNVAGMPTLAAVSPSDIRARRLIAQLLAPSAPHPLSTASGSIAEVATWMTAVQSENAAAGRDVLPLRSSREAGSVSPQDLADAGIVRSWSQRGTHHLLPARDVR